MYASRPLEQVVTSVSWCPNGEYFAVGSRNLVRLCDKTGWTYSRERMESGSLMQIAWTADGTQFAGAGGNGSQHGNRGARGREGVVVVQEFFG